MNAKTLGVLDVNALHKELLRDWGIPHASKAARPQWLADMLKADAQRKRERRNRARLNHAYSNPSQRFKDWESPIEILRDTGYAPGNTVTPRKGSGDPVRIVRAGKNAAGRATVRLSNDRVILVSTLRKNYIRISG